MPAPRASRSSSSQLPAENVTVELFGFYPFVRGTEKVSPHCAFSLRYLSCSAAGSQAELALESYLSQFNLQYFLGPLHFMKG